MRSLRGSRRGGRLCFAAGSRTIARPSRHQARRNARRCLGRRAISLVVDQMWISYVHWRASVRSYFVRRTEVGLVAKLIACVEIKRAENLIAIEMWIGARARLRGQAHH